MANCSREKWWDFYNRLGSDYSLSAPAVTAIVNEITVLTDSLHSYTVQQLAHKLGEKIEHFLQKIFFFKGLLYETEVSLL
jgi:hypothetical protein